MSRSNYYRKTKKEEGEEKELEKAVIHCFEKHKGRYGRIRIWKELQSKGFRGRSERKIARILRESGLAAKSGRTEHRRKQKPTGQQYIEENLIKDKFTVTVPNMLWCSDITELVCLHSKLY